MSELENLAKISKIEKRVDEIRKDLVDLTLQFDEEIPNELHDVYMSLRMASSKLSEAYKEVSKEDDR